MDTDDLSFAGRRVLSVFIRVYPWLKIKPKKKKVAFPRRTWQTDPVTRRLVGTPRCGVRSARRAGPTIENLHE